MLLQDVFADSHDQSNVGLALSLFPSVLLTITRLAFDGQQSQQSHVVG